jgi:hypothetical protein
MLTLPKISLAKTSIAALFFLAFSNNISTPAGGSFNECASATPFTVMISGLHVSGHVCGKSEIKIPHQINFKLQADEDQHPIILKQLTGFSIKSSSDATGFPD